MPVPNLNSNKTQHYYTSDDDDDDDDSLYNEQPTVVMTNSQQINETTLDSSEDIDFILDAEDDADAENQKDDDDDDADDADDDDDENDHEEEDDDDDDIGEEHDNFNNNLNSSVENHQQQEQQRQNQRHRYRRRFQSTSTSPTDPNSPSPPRHSNRRNSTNNSNNIEDDVDLNNLEYVQITNNENNNNIHLNNRNNHINNNTQENDDPPSDDINVDIISMVNVSLTPRGNNNIENDDLRFDSDEHVDVESLSTSDDENDNNNNIILNKNQETKHHLPRTTTQINNNNTTTSNINNINTDPAHVSSAELLSPSSLSTRHSQRNLEKRSQNSTASLLSRASKTFYKTFIGRKTSNNNNNNSSNTHKKDKNKKNSSNSLDHKNSFNNENNNFIVDEKDDRYERLCRLIDAQLSALDGAKTGFVQLGLLRPLAEQTLNAISNDARLLLGDFGKLEIYAQKKKEEFEIVSKKGEEEIVQKEQLLIESKVALAEACGEIERLRGELASCKRKLDDPMIQAKRLRKQRDMLKNETASCKDTRIAVEGKLFERRTSLSKEKSELGRLEKEFRDIEGDWA